MASLVAWLVALLLVPAFLALAHAFGLLRATRRVLAVVEQAYSTLTDDALDEDAKESALQKHAVQSLGLFAWLIAGAAGALGLPLAVIWLVDELGWLDGDAVLEVAVSWPFLLVTLVGGILVWRWWTRRHPPAPVPSAQFENRYSTTDRLLHLIAFTTPGPQLMLARGEDRLFQRRLATIEVRQPVFIAGLPRAGTTLLLELCAGLEGFVTHTYRHMPFVLTPVLWEKFTRPFRVAAPLQPRAHGDGMLVGPDSPEALEEVLWLTFWPEHYADDRIHPWQGAHNAPAFLQFFQQHIRKLIRVAQADHASRPPRYVSKNNLNIARIAWLTANLPDAQILVPFRAPLQHAASLLRQHRNFLRIHASDAFARRYMAAIGHFDFGANLRPIDFDGWLKQVDAAPTTLTFWLRYWIACYGHLLQEDDPRVRFLDFDGLCRSPGRTLAAVTEFLQVPDPARLIAGQERVHSPRPHDVDTSTVPADVLDAAAQVHTRLTARALNAPTPNSRLTFARS